LAHEKNETLRFCQLHTHPYQFINVFLGGFTNFIKSGKHSRKQESGGTLNPPLGLEQSYGGGRRGEDNGFLQKCVKFEVMTA
jgi:hypothetical protein